MRALLAAVVAAALLWSGYWVVGAWATERAIAAWMRDRRADGWVAEAGVDVRGFPNRFDATLSDPRLASPGKGLAWSAPFFQILALSYNPTHFIAAWPPRQTFEAPAGKLVLDAEKLRGSLVVEPGGALPLDRLRVVGNGLRLVVGDGAARLAEFRFAMRQDEAGPNAYEVGVDASKLRPPSGLLGRVGEGAPPATVKTLSLDATLALDAPLDRHAVAGPPPRIQSMMLHEASAVWGDLELTASGGLAVTPRGVPEGTLTVTARNWQRLVTLAGDAGLLAPETAARLETGLAAVAGLSGNGDTLEVPLVFADGRVRLGPVPLGPVPRLAQRQ